MLVFFGVIFFAALAIAVCSIGGRAIARNLEVLKRIYAGFIPLPWILAATLFLNGRLDSPKKVTYHAATVDGRYNMPGIVRGTRRLFVRSWREGQKYERLAVDADDTIDFKAGDSVVVGCRAGSAWHSLVLWRLSPLVLAAPHVSTRACRRVSAGFAVPGRGLPAEAEGHAQ